MLRRPWNLEAMRDMLCCKPSTEGDEDAQRDLGAHDGHVLKEPKRKGGRQAASEYRARLIEGFWRYKEKHFPDDRSFRPRASEGGPLVFAEHWALANVLVAPGTSEKQRQEVLLAVPRKHWHRWFRSMTSSQALSQSVFANLRALGKLEILAEIRDDDGQPVFAGPSGPEPRMTMEYQVTSLGEPRPTSVDAFFDGDYRIAVECKLAEAEVGYCSRPELKPNDAAYDREYCDGRYARQRRRAALCALTARGIKYWDHIPRLFKWSATQEHNPCPLRTTYQLVRNVLAACVREDGHLPANGGHAALLYDERNPAFCPGGKGHKAFAATRGALKEPARLRSCTWQTVVAHLALDDELAWLVGALREKYGLQANVALSRPCRTSSSFASSADACPGSGAICG